MIDRIRQFLFSALSTDISNGNAEGEGALGPNYNEKYVKNKVVEIIYS